jgi:glycosyltransferase involved in cell wall biosynthesis
MVTYRHEPFLVQAIESVLEQRTKFSIELVIGDDSSPDGTAQIARDFAARFPDRIRFHSTERNLGLTYNLDRTIGQCRGQYVAWLEGDDYWISPDKLQRQADFLDANPDCAWCFTRAIVVDEEGRKIQTKPVIHEARPKYTLAEYLDRLFQPRACTVMFRHRLFAKFPGWFFEMPTGDMPLHVLNGEHGDIGLVDEEMAAYRIHPGGVWSSGVSPTAWVNQTPEHRRRAAARHGSGIKVYEAVDAHHGGKHRKILRRHLAKFAYQQTFLWRSLEDWPQMRRSVRTQLRSLPLPDGVGVSSLLRSLVVSHLPFLALPTRIES